MITRINGFAFFSVYLSLFASNTVMNIGGNIERMETKNYLLQWAIVVTVLANHASRGSFHRYRYICIIMRIHARIHKFQIDGDQAGGMKMRSLVYINTHVYA